MTSLVLRPRDVGALFRLMGEAREIARAGGSAQRHVTVGLGELVGADVSISGSFRVKGGAEALEVEQCVDVGWGTDSDRALVLSYVGRSDDRFSVAMCQAAAGMSSPMTWRRCDLVGDREWSESAITQDVHPKVGLDDVMMGVFSATAAGHIGAFIFKRRRAGGQFSKEERDLLQLYLLEGRDSDERRRQALLHPSLSPRLRQVLELLLAGQSEKDAASSLSISPSTLHGYVKELYKKLGVRSRAELLARYLRESP
jgi:DNA-binding CsgD family transcriptional regulator